MNFKKFVLKIVRVIISMTIKLEDFNNNNDNSIINNYLIDKKSHENTLFYDVSHKNLIVQKPLRIRFDKTDRSMAIHDGKI